MEEQHLPTLIQNIPRHPMMRDEETDYFKELREEMKLDAKLGLENQMTINAATILKRDIEEITSSNDYYPVSDSILKKLFQFNRLKLMCLSYNTTESLKTFANCFKWSIMNLTIAAIAAFAFFAFQMHLGVELLFACIGIFCFFAIFFVDGRPPTKRKKERQENITRVL